MKRIILTIRGKLDFWPPVVAACQAMSRLAEVLCVCSSVSRENEMVLEELGVSVIQLDPAWRRPSSPSQKVCDYVRFHTRAWRAIEEHAGPAALLWIAKADTARALGRRLRKYRYVLQALELHDAFPSYQRALKRYCRSAAAVVACEHSRAVIMRVWYGLPRTPFVVPNKPYFHPREPRQTIRDAAASAVVAEQLRGRKMLLYQGALSRDRDLAPLAEAARRLPEFALTIMGDDRIGRLAALRAVCPSLVHLRWLPPPAHLEVTSHAYIGLAAYDFDCLNNVFCAPNKIWEYTGFGIPMVCQDLPGLRNTVGTAGAAECVSFGDINLIESAIRKVAGSYEVYGACARRFYDSFDLENSYAEILDFVAGKHSGLTLERRAAAAA